MINPDLKCFFSPALVCGLCLLSAIPTNLFAQPSDPNATPQAEALWDRLATLGEQDRFAFGQQNANVYGINANGTAWNSNGNTNTNRSDIKTVTGRHPAVFGFNALEVANYPGYPSRFPESQPWLEQAELRNRIQDAHRWGGIITIYWPLNYLVHNNAWVTPSSLGEVKQNGLYYNSLTNHLQQLSDFLETLNDDSGQPIPFVFRPWHEHTGGWFWWCPADTLASRQDFIALYRLTVDYLRARGRHSFLTALSPSGHRLGVDRDFFYAYPGDAYVDVYAVDMYFCADRDFADQQGGYEVSKKPFFQPSQFWQAVNLTADAVLSKEANGIKKLLAIGEFGAPDGIWGNASLTAETKANFFNGLFLNDLVQNVNVAKRRKISYAMTWRNGSSTHGWVPNSAHAGAADLVAFANDPRVELLDANLPPVIAPIDTITIPPHLLLRFPIAASDPNGATQSLTWSLAQAPLGATLDSASGMFSWRPEAESAGRTNLVRVRVSDNGVPSMSVTQSFSIRVTQVGEPVVATFRAGALELNGAALDPGQGAQSIRILSSSPALSDTSNLISGNQYNSAGARLHRSLLSFELSRLAEMGDGLDLEIASVELQMTNHAIHLGPNITGINQDLHATDPFGLGASWATTDGVTPWPMAGGTQGTLLSSVRVDSLQRHTWPSTAEFVAAAQSALDREDRTLYLLLKGAFSSNQDNRSQFRSATWGEPGERPALRVTFTVQPMPPPELTVQCVGNSIEISWPAAYTNYVLQKQDALGLQVEPQYWVPVEGLNSNRYVEPNLGSAFFRLMRQD